MNSPTQNPYLVMAIHGRSTDCLVGHPPQHPPWNEDFMRRKRFGLRTITGLLLAGLVAFGLQPGTATAASEAVRGPNMALGKSVTAGGSHAGHPAANVTDGSRLSYWEGPAGAFPQWVRVDLG